MYDWRDYEGHIPIILGQKKKYDNTIYTFDIETTSFFKLDNKIRPAINYITLSKEKQENSEFFANMYIWMFSINDKVYYGRTWDEFYNFLNRLEFYAGNYRKFVYVHHLAFEFNFLRNIFTFENVFARKSRKVMKCDIKEFNIEFRCSYILSNCSLENLTDTYQLPVQKLVGNLDYSKIRNSKTKLTEKEFAYCENDCLVL